MAYSEKRVSWAMTALICFGALSTASISIGVSTLDETLTVVGAIGEVLVVCVAMIFMFVCVKYPRQR